MPDASTQSPQTNAPRCFALLPCAGSGARAGTATPKQYQPLAGLPLVLHTLAALQAVPRVAGCMVVVAPGDRFLSLDHPDVQVLPCGASSRAGSVFNGLQALLAQDAAPDDWVLVHDAARCLVTPQQVNALLDACWDDPVGGLLALKLPDTLKVEANGRVAATVDRSDKWLAQTPHDVPCGCLARSLGCHRSAGLRGRD